MGQSCMKKQTSNKELQCSLDLILPISHSHQVKRPIYELCYIRGREETKDENYDLDLETRKSQKKEVRFLHHSKTNFQLGVKQQKQLIKNQLKTAGADLSQIFNKKKNKLVRSDRDGRVLEYNNRIHSIQGRPNRQGTYSSNNRSFDNSQSPLQLSLKQRNDTLDSIKDEIKSFRSTKTPNKYSAQGILKQQKGKAKSMYYKRTVRFQF